MRKLVLFLAASLPMFSYAQWSVYDEKVYNELIKINNVARVNSNTDLNQAFKAQESSGSSGQTITFGINSDRAEYKGVDTKFEDLSISTQDAQKYVGTEQDCGSNSAQFLKHYKACVGLRNLRLQTLKQSQDMLKVLNKRREQIVRLVDASRGASNESGIMQRYHFELQAQQSLLQTDAMQLQVLMEGYKQREKTYEMQMAEAKRERDTGRFDSGKGVLRKPAVPFVIP
jgi:hypothetical protein